MTLLIDAELPGAVEARDGLLVVSGRRAPGSRGAAAGGPALVEPPLIVRAGYVPACKNGA